MQNEELVLIPGRLHNPADGGHVAGASDIIDDDLNKLQSEINAEIKIFGASGNNHSAGLVPDPGSTQGNAKYLREDGLWESPPDTTYNVVSKTAAGLCPQLPNETTKRKFLRQDGTWQIPSADSIVYSGSFGGSCNLCGTYGSCGIYSVFSEARQSGGVFCINGTTSNWIKTVGDVSNDFTLAVNSNNVWVLTTRGSARFSIVGVQYS